MTHTPSQPSHPRRPVVASPAAAAPTQVSPTAASPTLATPAKALAGTTRTASRSPIELQIGHLVVEGVEVRDPEAFRAALEAELARQLEADPRALDGVRDTTVAQVEAPRARQPGSTQAGIEVARGLIRGLGR